MNYFVFLKKQSIRFILFLFCVIFLAEVPFVFGLFHTVQEKMTDRLFLNKSVSKEVVIVAIDDASLSEVGQWPWPRVVFAQVLEQLTKDVESAGIPKAIGVDVSFSEASSVGSVDDDVFARTLSDLRAREVRVVLPIDLGNKNQIMSQPLASFMDSTAQGFIVSPIDGDGVVRRAETRRGAFESFAHVLVGGEAPDSFRIDYRGTNGFVTVSFADVLHGRIPNRIFKDKIVLIGATAPNLHDFVATPFNQMPGVVLNANQVETLRERIFFQDVDPRLMYGIFALICLITCVVVRRVKRFRTLTLVLAGLFFVLIVDAAIAFGLHIIVPLFYELLVFVFSMVAALAFEYITVAKEKAFIKNSFQYYLTPHVIDELLKHPEKLSLGGESRRMTILFSDIRGFTTISESLSPEELTQLLNEYLTAMTDIIMEHGGVVDKYIGDAIMAFWGAPLDDENQEAEACASSVEMMQKLSELNKTWKTPLAIGIGMNTGNVVVGNMGSKKRFNYTVMGDEVNLASRLERLTKYYRVSVLASESTQTAVQTRYPSPFEGEGMGEVSREVSRVESNHVSRFRELDLVIVKGKKEPTKIFELIVEESSDALEQAHRHFQSGRALYAKGDWNAAIAEFKKAIALNDDGPSKLFVERCEKFREHPPENWNGVYSFESK